MGGLETICRRAQGRRSPAPRRCSPQCAAPPCRPAAARVSRGGSHAARSDATDVPEREPQPAQPCRPKPLFGNFGLPSAPNRECGLSPFLAGADRIRPERAKYGHVASTIWFPSQEGQNSVGVLPFPRREPTRSRSGLQAVMGAEWPGASLFRREGADGGQAEEDLSDATTPVGQKRGTSSKGGKVRGTLNPEP